MVAGQLKFADEVKHIDVPGTYFFVGEGSRVRVSRPEMILILFFFFLFLFFVGEGAGAQGCVSAGPR